MVALSDAWQKGAQQLSPEQRRDLANDPRNLQAVDGPTNSKKSESDAASWLPPNKSYRCTYVCRPIDVKALYKAVGDPGGEGRDEPGTALRLSARGHRAETGAGVKVARLWSPIGVDPRAEGLPRRVAEPPVRGELAVLDGADQSRFDQRACAASSSGT